MKEKNTIAFDVKDDKAVQIFTELGMPKTLAKTLIYIYQVDECRSADIEHGADLRQPEVSVAITELQNKGWVKTRYQKKKGKGRPTHIYTPAKTFSSIVKVFEQEKLKEIKTIQKDISELGLLLKSR